MIALISTGLVLAISGCAVWAMYEAKIHYTNGGAPKTKTTRLAEMVVRGDLDPCEIADDDSVTQALDQWPRLVRQVK